MNKTATIKQLLMLAAMASCLGAVAAKAEHGEPDEAHPVGGPVPHYIMHAGDKLPPGVTADNVPPSRDPNIKIPDNVMKYKDSMPAADATDAPAESKPVEGVDIPLSHDLGR